MFFTIHYTIPTAEQYQTGILLANSKEEAIRQLMRKHPKAEIKRVIY